MEWAHEVWAEALWVEQHKGAEAPEFIAERVSALAKQGDEDGVARWRRIAEALDQLRAGTAQ
jgi:hypothetical protein